MQELVISTNIEEHIILIRGQRVMLIMDLAKIYGVTTKRLSEQIRRNKDRFPMDFMFRLTPQEKSQVVAECDRLAPLKYSINLPYAFTEHGALMVANVLNSPTAVKASLQVVRAFVKIRRILSSNKLLARKLYDLEKKYDGRFKVVFDAIHRLMNPVEVPVEPKKRKIGFHPIKDSVS